MKKVIVILSLTIFILSSIYAIIESYPPELFVVIFIALLYILTSLVVWLNINPPKASKAFLMIISVLIALFPLSLVLAALSHILPDRLYSGAYLGIIILGFSAVLLITTFLYIIRILRPYSQAVLISGGILCAMIGAAVIMWYSYNSPINTLRRQLNDKDPTTRARAIFDFGVSHDKESIPRIREFVNDNDFNVRGYAIWALGALNDKESIPEIRKLLDADTMSLRSLSILTLAHLDDKESAPEIRKILKSKNDELMFSVIYALGMLGDKESIPQIKELLNHKYEHVRKESERALKKLGVSESEIEEAKKAKEGN